ncbi:hypothetical protein ACERNI_13580 [Camelimonas sp. ID_303_24]
MRATKMRLARPECAQKAARPTDMVTSQENDAAKERRDAGAGQNMTPRREPAQEPETLPVPLLKLSHFNNLK